MQLDKPSTLTRTPTMEDNTDILTTQEEKILNYTQENPPLPCGFFFTEQGLMHQRTGAEGKPPPPPAFICSRLEITACTRDDANKNHGRLLEFKDIDNHPHSWAMPMELLAGDGTGYREILLSMGLNIASGKNARELLATYIQSAIPSTRARCVNQIGWHKSRFVLPDITIGDDSKEKIILQSTSSNLPEYSSAKGLSDWCENISKLCVGNSRLIFSVSIAFAAPLLHLLGLENGGFHFRGPSSTGKTTTLAVANSVWGPPKNIQRWRSTTNGLEALAATHNDTPLSLDELSQVDPHTAGENAYMLANGSGKNRAAPHGLSSKKHTWRLLFLSTGEISLANHMMEDGKKIRAGQEIRVIDIPVDSCKYGMFEELHGRPNGAAFSEELTQKCAVYYGTAAREFIRLLIAEEKQCIIELKRLIEDFKAKFTPKNADGQIHRAAKRFGLVAAAGELATAFGITGWKIGEAIKAAEECFNSWLSNRGGVESQEEIAIVSQVKDFFERHGDSRFAEWTDRSPNYPQKTNNRAGFKKSSGNEIEYFVFQEAFKRDIAAGHDHRLVARICAKNGLLHLGSNNESTRSERLPGQTGTTRCYRFTSAVLSDSAGGNNEQCE